MSEMIDQYLDELETSKEDIKQSLINKGVTPTGGLTSYAEAVDSIKSNLGTATVSITKNGTQTITAEEYGYDGMSKVDVTVQVASGGSDKPQIFNGFRFTGGDIAQVDFSQYDWSLVYDTSEFFGGCTHSTGDWSNFLENFNGEILSVRRMFGSENDNSNIGVSSIPNLGDSFSKITDMSEIFKNNSKLTDISPMYNWNTRNVINATEAFCASSSWGNAPQITDIDLTNFGHPDGYESYQMFRYSPVVNVSGLNAIGGYSIFSNSRNLETVSGKLKMIDNGTNAPYTFSSCYKLSDMSGLEIDTSNVTNMSYMFSSCEKLTSIPQLDTSNVTNMNSMFSGCKALTTIPQLDFSNVTNMNSMFRSCSSLISVPDMDFPNVTDVGYMLRDCSSLGSIGDLKTSKITKFCSSYDTDSWLFGCYNLQKLGVVDCDSVTDIKHFFGNSKTYLTDFGGCRNLGKASTVANTNSDYFMMKAPNLTYGSVMNVINGLYDRATAGLSVLTLKLHANHLAMLSEDDIAIATNKGWTIV